MCVQKELRFYSIPMYSGGSSHIWTKERDLGWWPSKRSPEYKQLSVCSPSESCLKAMGTSNIATWYQVTVMKIQSLWVRKTGIPEALQLARTPLSCWGVAVCYLLSPATLNYKAQPCFVGLYFWLETGFCLAKESKNKVIVTNWSFSFSLQLTSVVKTRLGWCLQQSIYQSLDLRALMLGYFAAKALLVNTSGKF